MEEILMNYQGIIAAIAGTVSGSVATLIATHLIKNIGRVTTTVFDVEHTFIDKDSLRTYSSIRIDFKVKFYNKSEMNKVLDRIEIIFLDNRNRELYIVSPNDLETYRSTKPIGRVDKMYFVNLPPKQLTLRKLGVEINDFMVKNIEDIKIIKLRYYNKMRKKEIRLT